MRLLSLVGAALLGPPLHLSLQLVLLELLLRHVRKLLILCRLDHGTTLRINQFGRAGLGALHFGLELGDERRLEQLLTLLVRLPGRLDHLLGEPIGILREVLLNRLYAPRLVRDEPSALHRGLVHVGVVTEGEVLVPLARPGQALVPVPEVLGLQGNLRVIVINRVLHLRRLVRLRARALPRLVRLGLEHLTGGIGPSPGEVAPRGVRRDDLFEPLAG